MLLSPEVLKAQITLIANHNRKNPSRKVQVFLTPSEYRVVAALYQPQIVLASIDRKAYGSLVEKIKKASNSIVKKMLQVLLPVMVLMPTAHGLSINSPDKAAKSFEQTSKEVAGVDLSVDTKESKQGGSQVVVWTIKDNNGKPAGQIKFVGTDSNILNSVDFKAGKDADPAATEMAKTWFETIQQIIIQQDK
jgi:hypothetical protein